MSNEKKRKNKPGAGAPPKYKDPIELQQKVEKYFKNIPIRTLLSVLNFT